MGGEGGEDESCVFILGGRESNRTRVGGWMEGGGRVGVGVCGGGGGGCGVGGVGGWRGWLWGRRNRKKKSLKFQNSKLARIGYILISQPIIGPMG